MVTSSLYVCRENAVGGVLKIKVERVGTILF